MTFTATEKKKISLSNGRQESAKIDKFASFLNESHNQTDQLRVRVMTEYFSMIEELLLVADYKMALLTNNFCPQIWKNVVKPIRNRFKVKALQLADNADSLEGLFVNSHADPLYCGEDTIFNLLSLYSIFDYPNAKVTQRAVFKEKKLDRVLSVIEKLQTWGRVSKSPYQQEPIVGFLKEFKRISGSVRGIDFKSKNKIVLDCN